MNNSGMHTRTQDQKFNLLRALSLPTTDYAIFGSAPLYANGLRCTIEDLDIIARGQAWRTVKSLGKPTSAPSGHGEMVELYGGKLQFFNQWTSPGWDADELIDSADFVDGLPFVQLSHVLHSKSQSNRPKDQDDLRALRAYFSSS